MAGKSDAKEGPRTLSSVQAAEGFDGQLRCATLADLVQLQCLSQARTAISVRADGRVGHLFFNQGQIVHAVSGDLTGETAAYQILSWTTGTFAYSSLPWPERNTVTSSWQRLLLNAAHQQDEQNRQPNVSTSRLMAVPHQGRQIPRTEVVKISSGPPAFDMDEFSQAPEPDQTMISSKPPGFPSTSPVSGARAERAWTAVLALQSLRSAARLDAQGNMLASHGNAEGLLGPAAYIRRLAEALGSDIGQAEFRVFECQSEQSSVLLFADSPHTSVIVEAGDAAELRTLRRSLQL